MKKEGMKKKGMKKKGMKKKGMKKKGMKKKGMKKKGMKKKGMKGKEKRNNAESDSQSLPSERCHSLAELTQYWNEQLPSTARASAQKLPTPLRCPKILPRDNSYNDYTGISWEPLLAGLEQRPYLDFAKSESAFRERTSTSTAQIQRYWDVDSFLARITTLAAHKHGFRLAYNAPYHQRITQSPRVKFGGYAPDKVAQIRLGQGLADGGWGYSTYVLFPHMRVTNSTYLGRYRRACWIDNIIYPALKASCPASILQHHPRGFQDALNRANVKTETNVTRGGQPFDAMYIVPASVLERFWAEVLRRANENEPFREPILVVAGHNLKLAFQHSSSAEARAAFLNHLDACYDTREEYMPTHETWLDFGAEDVPIRKQGPTGDGITVPVYAHAGCGLDAVNLDQDKPSTFAVYTKTQQIKAYEASKTRVAQALLAANREKMNFGVRQEYRITLARFRELVLDLDVWTHGLWELPSTLSEEDTTTLLATSPSPLLSAEDDSGIQPASSEESTRPSSPSRSIARPLHRGFWILPTQEVHDFIAATTNR
ncbi:hypothetical protein N7G274_008060 [Stereocaulon virgatum]|uniref:Uncharacterized protein n=1 Tax=Stereocaulon virgatum TaxID=373712 RepID=A0ABR4A151_9LECA